MQNRCFEFYTNHEATFDFLNSKLKEMSEETKMLLYKFIFKIKFRFP